MGRERPSSEGAAMTGRPTAAALAALALAWGAARADDGEAEAVRAVQRLGGSVERDPSAPGRPVVGVDLYATAATDADVRRLLAFGRLRWLDLGETRVTDAGVRQLGCLPELRGVTLCDTAVSDDGLKALAGLERLRTLDLGRTAVTDAGLKHLAGLRGLRALVLRQTRVTAFGVAALQTTLPDCGICHD
jgi:hypothetical protein